MKSHLSHNQILYGWLTFCTLLAVCLWVGGTP